MKISLTTSALALTVAALLAGNAMAGDGSDGAGHSNGPLLHREVHVSVPLVDPLEWVNRVMP